MNEKRGIEPPLPSFDDSKSTWRGLTELEPGTAK